MDAVKRVKSGKSIMALNHVFAVQIANAIGTDPYSAEIDKNKENVLGYYFHYHNPGEHGDPHIWFYGPKMF